MLPFLFGLYCICSTQSRSLLGITSNGTTTLPRESTRQTASFDGVDKILLIGGTYEDDVISFDINTKSFDDYEGNDDIKFQNVRFSDTYAQAWSQIGDNLYWMDTDATNSKFLSLTLSNIDEYIAATKYVVDPFAIFPITFGSGYTGPAFTHHIDGYFIVSGGRYSNFDYSKQILIYNISSDSWLPNTTAPSMIYDRTSHSTIVHPMNRQLYIIGGWGSVGIDFHDQITKLDVTNMGNFSGKSVIEITPKLSIGKYGCRTVSYGQYIFVIGGVYQSSQIRYYPKTFEIIDVLNNDMITTNNTLSYGVAYPAIIIVNSVLYIFGGDNYAEVTDPTKSTKWQYYNLPPTESPTNAPTTPEPTYNPTANTSSPSLFPTYVPTPATPSPTYNPTITTVSPTPMPVTLSPSYNPTDISTTSVTPSPTLHMDTSSPTKAPSINPTKIPSINPAKTTTINPTTSTFDSFTTTTVISSYYDEGGDGESKENSISLNASEPLFYLVLFVSLFAAILVIICIIYLLFISKISQRTKQIGTATSMETWKQFGVFQKISFFTEIIDAITDYLFALELIINNNAALGWISLFSAIIGCVIFYIKFVLSKKLMGFQIVKLKEEFQQNTNNENKQIGLMNEIRQRRMDINMVSLLIACFEDCPQTIIVVLVVTSNTGWSAFSLLSISLSILSFFIKMCQVVMTKYGCLDPDDLHNQDTVYHMEQETEMITTEGA